MPGFPGEGGLPGEPGGGATQAPAPGPVFIDGEENPLPDLAQFIYERLTGDDTLVNLVGGADSPRVYMDEVPQGKTDSGNDDALIYPCVLYSVIDAPSVNANGAQRGLTNALVQIVAINRTKSLKSMKDLGKCIDRLFAGKYSGQVDALYISGGYVVRSIGRKGSDEGVTYCRIGGDFQIMCHHYVQPE